MHAFRAALATAGFFALQKRTNVPLARTPSLRLAGGLPRYFEGRPSAATTLFTSRYPLMHFPLTAETLHSVSAVQPELESSATPSDTQEDILALLCSSEDALPSLSDSLLLDGTLAEQLDDQENQAGIPDDLLSISHTQLPEGHLPDAPMGEGQFVEQARDDEPSADQGPRNPEDDVPPAVDNHVPSHVQHVVTESILGDHSGRESNQDAHIDVIPDEAEELPAVVENAVVAVPSLAETASVVPEPVESGSAASSSPTAIEDDASVVIGLATNLAGTTIIGPVESGSAVSSASLESSRRLSDAAADSERGVQAIHNSDAQSTQTASDNESEVSQSAERDSPPIAQTLEPTRELEVEPSVPSLASRMFGWLGRAAGSVASAVIDTVIDYAEGEAAIRASSRRGSDAIFGSRFSLGFDSLTDY